MTGGNKCRGCKTRIKRHKFGQWGPNCYGPPSDQSGRENNFFGMESLPPELIEKILEFLSHKDLCNMALTSTRLWAIASDPKFWSRIEIKKQKIKQDRLSNLFFIHRYSKIRCLDLSNVAFVNERIDRILHHDIQSQLNAIYLLSSVKELILYETDISDVSPNLLAQIAGYVEKINLGGSSLTSSQCKEVLRMCVTSFKLVDLSISRVDLSNVPPKLLGKAACHLQTLDISSCDLTIEHIHEVLRACVKSTTLTNLDLTGINGEEFDESLLAGAAANLKRLSLRAATLYEEPCLAVLQTCTKTSPLVSLDLGWNGECWNNIPINVLKQAVTHLRELYLENSELSTEQFSAVLEACTEASSLRSLYLGYNIDLKDLPSQSLKQAATHLNKLELSWNNLSTEQSIAVLEACTGTSPLEELSLELTDLTEVPAHLLKQAVGHLKYCDLNDALLTSEQCAAVMETCIQFSTSKVLMFYPYVKELGVSNDLFSRAVKSGRFMDSKHSESSSREHMYS